MVRRRWCASGNVCAADARRTAAVSCAALISLSFDWADVALLGIVAVLIGWYLWTRHWLANNIIALSLATTAIEMIALSSFQIGSILLIGLFVYDIFWVFGTNVMVAVATGLDAPIKLLVPWSWLLDEPRRPLLLGLGDIVVPGILIALLLRFDYARALQGASRAAARGRRSSFARPYYAVALLAYLLGLVLTISVMHVYGAAQPALLYLTPACLGAAVAVAVARGEVPLLLAYRDPTADDAAPHRRRPRAGTHDAS